MGESAAGTAMDSEKSEGGDGKDLPRTRDVVPTGDIVLDVTLETSKGTLKESRKALNAANRKHGTRQPSTMVLKPKIRVAYRVSLDALRKNSKYFSNLLTDTRFREAKIISDAHSKLAAMKVRPGEADAKDLPWITITDDDTASRAAGREDVLEDMLSILHGKPPKTTKVTMSYATTLAIVADRFDCVSAISRSLNHDLKFKWPLTNNRPLLKDDGTPTETEKVLRQKVLVSWLLGQPNRLHNSTRELIMRGSCLWSDFHDTDTAEMTAIWWHLPDGLEEELRFRRECILNAIGSVQRHFLTLYSSRERQCPLGYDTSGACDSFQLGQMFKFFMSSNLTFPVDFSPISLQSVPDLAMIDVEELLLTLQKCPNYQLDKHHTNCGLRVRLEPILGYIRAMLASNAVTIPHADWKRRHSEVSWLALREREDASADDAERTFEFTRAIASEQRLQHAGSMSAEKMAKGLFTARQWNWTPEASDGVTNIARLAKLAAFAA